MKSEVIKLISVVRTKDSIGQYIDTESERQVFCSVGSVSGNEFFSAGQNGIKATYRFTMFAPDYNGEKIIEFKGDRFDVYRTYLGKNDTIDLYVESRVGSK